MNWLYRSDYTVDTFQWHYPRGLIVATTYTGVLQMEDLIDHSLL